jgi:hypothetical protein
MVITKSLSSELPVVEIPPVAAVVAPLVVAALVVELLTSLVVVVEFVDPAVVDVGTVVVVEFTPPVVVTASVVLPSVVVVESDDVEGTPDDVDVDEPLVLIASPLVQEIFRLTPGTLGSFTFVQPVVCGPELQLL